MYRSIENILLLNEPLTLILNNGFEDRSVRGAELIYELGLKPEHVLLLKYPGEENKNNYEKISQMRKALVPRASQYREVDLWDVAPLASFLESLEQHKDRIVCDITGLSRSLLLRVLTQIYRKGLKFSLIYTEAEEYYPREEDFRSFLKLKDPSDAFNKLTAYEEAEIVYSSNCEVEEIAELSGRIFPNHPVMLLAFLAFKRSRLSCILNQYETNTRILINSIPIRSDLKWREKALEIINFDLIDENRNSIVTYPTLYWEKTYDFLTELYSNGHIRYRFNVLLAPLGGKMQTVGAWYFAIKNPDVKVITSTPRKHFPKKYSIGYTDTHLICMDCVYNEMTSESEIA